jgi:drug/metabolite transporter (DMT)-like permease
MRSGSEEDLSIQDEEASLLMRSEDFDFDNRSKCRSIARRIFTWTNLFLVTFLLLQAGILFLQKKVSQRMYNYPFVLTISQPICTTILFGLLTLTNHVYNMLKTKKAAQINVAEYYDTGDYTVDKIRSIRIKKQKTPIYRLLILGGLIILSNFLAYCGSRGNLVPGPVVVLLQQLVVPVTLVLSIIFLKTRYKLWHYLGAAFILTGIFIVLWPKLEDADFTDNAIWAMLLLIVSSIPMSSAIVYMEHALKNTKLGIFYMWMWVNIFEFIVAVPLVFAIVPIQGTKIILNLATEILILDLGIPISETWTNIVNGYKCLIENEPTLPEDQCDIGT